ncbi:NAD dependent epimerase/dehydratase family protein [Lineolata rhizophorae]|uniref:NAD dependent epimerase/dehydratase family protein n=1 Tax=Lineolata rhizophorae TaxID=578093 RepID=A0A6A6P6U6_9PEZI|nr:NAD dependent epimerase/dehydratase family protein [Lineolata rhizophorae]
MPSAIVAGATGILGREIVFELAEHNDEFDKVYALSRSKKEDYPANVIHHHLDLTWPAEDIAKDLKGIEAEHLFFAAYLQKDSEEENTKLNGDMLEGFLQALNITGAASKLRRVVLVTGCKQYGVHLGAVKTPMHESDAWLPEPPFPPNFYYRQQRIVHEWCGRQGCSWVVTYPNDVLGHAEGNFMNLALALALYGAVTAELAAPDLAFPGAEAFYVAGADCFTASRLHARFCRWAALEPAAADNAFNVVNGDVETWRNLWPKVARRFGLKVAADQFESPAPLRAVVKLAPEPPLAVTAAEHGLLGRAPQGEVESRIDLTRWSQLDEVKAAWARLADREGLKKDAFEKATWGFLNFVLGRNYDLIISMSKARKMGWTGYVDTWDSLSDCFDQLERANIIPFRAK